MASFGSTVDAVYQEYIRRGKKGLLTNNGYGYSTEADLLAAAKKEKKYVVQFHISATMVQNSKFKIWLARATPTVMRWIGVITGNMPTSSNPTSSGGKGTNQTALKGVTWSNGNSSQVTVTMVPASCNKGNYDYKNLYQSTWKNYCTSPSCKKPAGSLVAHATGPTIAGGKKTAPEGELTCTSCGADFDGVTGYEKSGKCAYALQRISGPTIIGQHNGQTENGTDLGDETGSGTGDVSSTEKSSFLSGEMTFEELINQICTATDTLFIVKKTHIHITDIPTLYAQAAYLRSKSPDTVKSENINLWQLEDGSYTLDVNQYGFYNTVNVVYNKGTWTESYQDLVSVYGEQPITYRHTTMDKYQAQSVAKAYLAAHVRDFGMTISAKVLHDGGIDIGDIVTLENPQTMKDYINVQEGMLPEFLYVKGISVDWEGDQAMYNDLELSFAPSNPDNPEVPETSGGSASSTSTDSAVKEVLKLAGKIRYEHGCGADYSCVLRTQTADCYGMSIFIKTELENRGVTAQIRGYRTQQAPEHRSVLYKDDSGKWQRFPYRDNPHLKDTWFVDTDNVYSGRIVS